MVFSLARIRIGILGVGNAASALVQGLYLCKEKGEEMEGIFRWQVGKYTPMDIEIVAAYDVDKRKVGRDLSEAIFSPPNNMMKLCDIPRLDVIVEKGYLADSLGDITKRLIKIDEAPSVDIEDSLKEKGVEILVNLVSSFSMESSRIYAKKSARARVAFINCVPVIIASDKHYANLYRKTGVPIVGDDLESQIGSTYIHRLLLEMLHKRGVKIKATYALDVGGSPESLAALEWRRVWLKSEIKTASIKSALPYDIPAAAGSVDYVDFLKDLRDTVVYIHGSFFAGAPITIEMKIRVPDSLNAFNPLVDVIRATKIALDRGISGPLESVSAYAFKYPPKRYPPTIAEKRFEAFIKGELNN